MKYLLLVAMLGLSSASLAAEWPEFQNYRSTLDTLRCQWVSLVQDDQQDQHSEDESYEDDEPDCD